MMPGEQQSRRAITRRQSHQWIQEGLFSFELNTESKTHLGIEWCTVIAPVPPERWPPGTILGQKAMQNKRKGEFLDSTPFFKTLFIYLVLAVLGLHCCMDFSLVATSRGYSVVWASHCSGCSCSGYQLQEHRLNRCGTWTELLQSMWDLPESGIKPMSLAGGFFTTESPGKPSIPFLDS